MNNTSYQHPTTARGPAIRSRLGARRTTAALGFALALALPFHALADVESDISTTDTPSGMLAGDLKALLETCISANQSNAPPGNPGPFTRGYKQIIVLLGQCFGGGFSNLISLGDNVIVGAAAHPDKESQAGLRHQPGGPPREVMLWFDYVNALIRLNTNAPLKAILDYVQATSPDTNAMPPPPSISPGGESIVLGDAMGVLQPTNSFHAVVFGGYSDVADKPVGAATRDQWLLYLGTVHAVNDMKDTLRYWLKVPETNIVTKTHATLSNLVYIITNTWAKMNDNEQFILCIADHGSRDTLVPPPFIRRYGNGYSANFITEPYLASENVERPSIRLNTSFVGQAGEVRFNAHCIGTLPASPGPAYHEFCFKSKLLRPVGDTNVAEVVVPGANVGIESWALSTGPVAGGDYDLGMDPGAAVINVRNGTGMDKTAFHAVYEGRLGTNISAQARRTQADGTPIADWAVGGPTVNYDWGNHVTTVTWEDLSNLIPDGGYASFSVISSKRPLRSLKYSWSPASPDPSDDLAPINLKSISAVTSSNLLLTLLAAPFITWTQQLDLTVRFAGNLIPPSQLYFNNPAITSLLNSTTQTVILQPETRETVSVTLPALSALDPLPTALVESQETWPDFPDRNRLSRITQIPMLPAADTTCETSCPGSGVFFTVNVAGGTFKWYKDGVLLPGETGGTLTLLDLSKTNAGIYTCIGTNLFEIKRKFFKLLIRDFILPLVLGPADITVKATGPSGAVVNYGGISASDACGMLDGSTFQADPPPGLFPIGTTEVKVSVADTFGNVGKHRFYTTVLPQGADLGISLHRTYVVLRWADTNAVLQCAPGVHGPWSDMSDTSPYVRSLDTQEYYRLEFQ